MNKRRVRPNGDLSARQAAAVQFEKAATEQFPGVIEVMAIYKAHASQLAYLSYLSDPAESLTGAVVSYATSLEGKPSSNVDVA